jgi:hypothetical protein
MAEDENPMFEMGILGSPPQLSRRSIHIEARRRHSFAATAIYAMERYSID